MDRGRPHQHLDRCERGDRRDTVVAPGTQLHGQRGLGPLRDRTRHHLTDVEVGNGARWYAPTAARRSSARAPRSGRSPSCGRAPSWEPKASSARSSRPRTPRSGPAPKCRTYLRRRRRHRRAQQHRRLQRVRQLRRREQVPDHHRVACPHGKRHHVRRAGHRRGRRLYRGRHGGARDVPPGALAISAGQQRIIADWVLRNRPGSDSAARGHARLQTPRGADPDRAPYDSRVSKP